MKLLCWLIGGYPTIEESDRVLDAFVAGGCEGVEWSIPVEDPYREQAHLKAWALQAYANCPDPQQHLAQIARFRQRHPAVAVYPGLYQATTLAVGVDKIISFCRENGIDTVFLVGTYQPELVQAYRDSGLMITTSVSYYMTEEEMQKAKAGSGFIYMQALPYQAEIDAGYGPERLAECIHILRRECPGRPIYCAKGIRKPEDLHIVREAGADGAILGSLLMNDYDDLDRLTATIAAYKAAGDAL